MLLKNHFYFIDVSYLFDFLGYKAGDKNITQLLDRIAVHIIPSVDDRKESSEDNLDYGDKFGEDYNDMFGPVEGLKNNLKNYRYTSLISLEGDGLKIR